MKQPDFPGSGGSARLAVRVGSDQAPGVAHQVEQERQIGPRALYDAGVDPTDRSAERLCDGLIEAGWLVALVAVPLFFNPLTNRSFEPDKIAVLRVVVLVMVGAWLVKISIGGRPTVDDRPRRLPSLVLLPVTALLASAVLSSNLSIDPQLSWWGCYQRGQGTLTLLCLIAVFLLTASHLRRIDQWRRAVFVVLLTSVAVSLYALMQGAGTDPLGWSASVRRASSSLGNPIFLGGYVLMAVFVAVRELGDAAVDLVRSSGASTPRPGVLPAGMIRVGVLLFAVAIQIIALAGSGSRGPLLGLVTGLFVLCLISALQLQAAIANDPDKPAWTRIAARWSWPAVVAVGLGAVAGLVAAGRSAVPIRPEPAAVRLTRAFDADSRSARVRINLWTAVLDMMRSSEPLKLLPDVDDPRQPFRLLVGYGPETLQLSLNRFLPEELVELGKRGSVPDRAHNAALDQLATTGLVGSVSWLWLMASVLLWGTRGLLPAITVRQRVLFWLVAGGSVPLAAAVSVAATGGWLWAGMVAPGALVLAVATFAAFALWAAGRRGGDQLSTGPRAAISAILMATVAAHLVETSFSFTTAATGLYFWFLAAVGVVVSHGRMTTGDIRRAEEFGARQVLASGMLAAVACVTLLFGLTLGTPGDAGRAVLGPGGAWRVPALTLGAALLLAVTSRVVTRRISILRAVLVFTAASVFPTVAFTSLLRFRLDAASTPDAFQTAERLSWLPVQYAWFVLIGAAAVGAAVAIRDRFSGVRALWLTATALTAVVALSGFAAPRILRSVRADVFAKFARAAINGDRPAAALELARRAVALAPLEDKFLALEARAAMASDAVGQGRSTAALELGERSMVRAVEIRPLDPDHVANLARLRVLLSDWQASQERRQWLEEQAGAGFERALQLRPGSAEYLAGLGGLMLRRGELRLAADALSEAVRRDRRYVPAVLALAQCQQAMAEEAASAGAHDLASGHLAEARRTLERSARSNPDSEPLRSALAALPTP